MNQRAAVVGAGIAGRLLALKLRRAGFDVTLFDKDSSTSHDACSFAAAGLLTPISEAGAASDPVVAQLGRRSLPLWAELLPTLPSPVVLGTSGSLTVAQTPDLEELFERHSRIQRRFAETPAVWLDPAGIVHHEPALAASGFAAGLYLPDEGYIQSHSAMQALQEAHRAEGVVAHYATPVTALSPHRVVALDYAWTFDLVFDCRGFAARADLPDLRGVRGELIEVHAPEVQLTLPIQVMHQRYPVYIVPRGHGVYAIGATCIESESTAGVSVKAALELLTAAYHVHPGFRFATIARLVADCRPAFPDNLPQVQMQPGLWRLNGLYRHGFLLAPVMVDLILRRLTGAPLTQEEQSLMIGASP